MATDEAVINACGDSTLALQLVFRGKAETKNPEDYQVFLSIVGEALRHLATRRERLRTRMAPVLEMKNKIVRCDGCHRKLPAYQMYVKNVVSCRSCCEKLFGCRNPDAVFITGQNLEALVRCMEEIERAWVPNDKMTIDYPCAVIFEHFRQAKAVALTWPFDTLAEARIFRSVTISGRAMDYYLLKYNEVKMRLDGCSYQITAWNEAYKALGREKAQSQ